MAKSVSRVSLWEETRRPQDRINDIAALMSEAEHLSNVLRRSLGHAKGVRTGGGEATVVIALITTKRIRGPDCARLRDTLETFSTRTVSQYAYVKIGKAD
ncbi:hypothetical protein ElyMa_005754400 [Elysia marginata]|uniref:Uncharacterized protein n=1 Tax=Elysia marginata TaxID=1093978 RepID=A0AAV4FPY0_9GAST|nr:hypothetical protein ElyMa_005754400 [Elysia marginata]